MYQFNPLGNITSSNKVWVGSNLGKCLKPVHEWKRICPSPGSTDWSPCGRGWWEYSALHYDRVVDDNHLHCVVAVQ